MARLRFDSEPCFRCGGEGILRGFSHIHGGVCFRCNGAKVALTRSGRRARAKYNEWAKATLVRPLSELRAGDRVLVPQQLASINQFARFKGARLVLEVDANRSRARIPYKGAAVGWLDVVEDADGARSVWVHMNPEVQRAPTLEELRAVAPTLGKGARLVEDEERHTSTGSAQ